MAGLDQFYGPNAGYVAELLERYRREPESVAPADRALLDAWDPRAEPAADGATAGADLSAAAAAAALAQAIRQYGHRAARLDPLGSDPPGDPQLEPAAHGAVEGELARLPTSAVGGPIAGRAATASEAIELLRVVYCGTTGYEFGHVQVPDERAWLAEAVESGRFRPPADPVDERWLLDRLTEVSAFERFLHRAYPGQTRFSVEGLGMMIPMLDDLLDRAAEAGTRTVTLGMAHRGRLNVLAHILGKPYERILAEFEGRTAACETAAGEEAYEGWAGDVKYHAGGRRAVDTGAIPGPGTATVNVVMAPNPSHLEFVNPVVAGMARAADEDRGGTGPPQRDDLASFAVLVHGDAAFMGQGVVAETLNLSYLPGYRTGGTLHLIANNQIGFTTRPDESRSTLYASDLAKGFEIPIVHVNADDPVACLAAVRLAAAYRARFHKDFLIDLIGYRRWGHNEGDEPSFTQPVMYGRIAQHPTVRELYATGLVECGTVGADEPEALLRAGLEEFQRVRERVLSRANGHASQPTGAGPEPSTSASQEPDPQAVAEGQTDEAFALAPVTTGDADAGEDQAGTGPATGAGPSRAGLTANGRAGRGDTSSDRGAEQLRPATLDELRELNDAMHRLPEGFRLNPKLERAVRRRRAAFDGPDAPIDWGYAETLAFATILREGIPIRLTGQDTIRGTFSQRHLAFEDAETAAHVTPLEAVPGARATFEARNSPLSENAALGFEYGYSIQAPDALVVWEAQYGDFINGGQVIVDEFVVSGQAKWGLRSGLVLLLPHAWEGQGPDHSGGRLERFLQLAAEDNIRVANCTTAAQYFHLLRRQAASLRTDPRPLVVMTPKSLLRHPLAAGRARELVEATFRPVLDDARAGERPERVRRVVLCSGKVWADVEGDERRAAAESVAIVRLEELYPFPLEELRATLAAYPNADETVWLQEEPRNMGAWTFVEPRLRDLLGPDRPLRYVGRPESASPAEGWADAHKLEQSRIVDDVLESRQPSAVGDR